MLGLLIGTAAAFAITEKLKLEKSPITGTFVSAAFSPVCGCARDKANISVKFRKKDTVTVTVLTAGRKPVRTLVEATPVQRGRNIFRWDGKTDTGAQAPDGTYRVQIHLAKAHRTILVPNTIELDTKMPVVIPTANRTAFSPDGDHQADSVTIHFTLSEPAHVLVYLGDRLLIRSRSHTTQGSVTWSGKTDAHLHPPGTVTLSVGAVDLAGNAIPAGQRAHVRVTIRYITLASRRIAVAAGKRFEVGVSTDARRYGWLLGGRHGFARGAVLRLRAPQHPGRYGCVMAAALAPDRPWKDIAEIVVAVGIGALLAVVFRRWPWLLPLAALATVPIRIGALGHQLLVPLYLVILGGTLLFVWQLVRGDERSRELRVAAWPLALYVGWTGLSLAWTGDVGGGEIEVLAFYVPFTMLALLVARLPWSDLWLRALYVELGVMALIFAEVGFYQYDTRNVFENPKVINSNAYAAYFRVNSVFWDPSIYGRFLVVAIIPSVVLIVRGRSLRLAWAAAAKWSR